MAYIHLHKYIHMQYIVSYILAEFVRRRHLHVPFVPGTNRPHLFLPQAVVVFVFLLLLFENIN